MGDGGKNSRRQHREAGGGGGRGSARKVPRKKAATSWAPKPPFALPGGTKATARGGARGPERRFKKAGAGVHLEGLQRREGQRHKAEV